MAAFKRRAIAPPQSEAAGDAEAHLVINESGLATQNDGGRAARYIQHIRALNSQFTSWAQQQLKEHPLELWQEGIQDYLRHASKIQDDFKDVIGSSAHTETNVGMQSRSLFSTQNALPKVTDGSIASGFGKSLFDLKGGPSVSLSFPSFGVASFPKAAPTGLPFLNIPSGSSALNRPPNNENDTQEDGDDAEEEPSSPSVKRAEEPGIKVVHEIKCKLYIKGDSTTDSAWKEMGMGNLTLRSKEGAEKGTKEAKATLLVRNEVGRVLLNALLYPNMKMNVQKNTVAGIFHSAEADVKVQGSGSQETDSGKGRLYLIKLRTPSDAEQLEEVLTSNAPRGE
ncbi:hypothetical protein GOP47_0021687 [Adiantum capillus-veneris]|uniref:RanBD1 domain-containing protein n=1 Tax=Adiantum capillus-veneris TaxID=13818 RepID=A0A9D4U873_ADICA|nr:hypothetical protein GOP47_0021687 [Adiantum capillus-veneris]